MGRPFPILLAASLSLFAAPALAEEEPLPATPTPAPPPASSAPAYSAPAYSVPAYSMPAPDGALSPAPEGQDRPPRPSTEPLRPGMMATGIAFVAIGVAAMSAGTLAYVVRIRDCNIIEGNSNMRSFARCPDDSIQYASVAFLIAGGAIAAFGIPLWIFGSSSVPAAPALRAARAPTLLIGPRGAALRVSF